MQGQSIAPDVVCAFTVLLLGCSSSAVNRRGPDSRDAYALASCTDTMSCCLQRNPDVPEACGLSAAEAAVYMAGIESASKHTVKDDGEDDGWKQHCIDTYVRCRDQKKPYWVGDCYACFRNCEGQREWPYELCYQR
nr:hypothetical protein [Corallococcus macrosporus]